VGQPTNLNFDRGFATYYNGLIYVQRSLKFQAYNPTTDTWITDLTPPTYGLVHTGLMHEYKGRLFIGSGWETAKAKNNPFIQYYDVAKDKWFVATRLEFKNHALGYGSMFLYDNKLYYIGGYSNEAEPNFNNLVRSFDLEKLQFEEIDYQRQLIQNSEEAFANKVIEHEKDLIDHEQRIDSIEAITRKQDSDIASVDDDGMGILHMGKDVAETTVTTKIDGLLLDAPQLVTNGDLSTTGGFTYDGTGSIVISGGELLYTSGQTTEFPAIRPNVNTIVANTKYYFISRVKVNLTTQETITLRISNNPFTAIATQTTPTNNQYYVISGVLQPSIATRPRIDIPVVSGDTITLDYLFQFNISTLITNKQYSPIYNITFDLMTDAQIKAQMDLWVQNGTLPNSIQSVDFNKRLTSVGKNLFDGVWENDVTNGVVDGYDVYILNHGVSRLLNVNCLPNTQYTLQFDYKYSGASGVTYLQFEYSDGSNSQFSLASLSSTSWTSRTHTTEVNKTLIGINQVYAGVGTTYLKNIQLEQGSTATTYEPYRSSSMYLDSGEVGYSLPNGVKDTIEFRNGQAYYVQRVKKYTLQASDITSLATNNSELDKVITKNDTILGAFWSDSLKTFIYVPKWLQITTNEAGNSQSQIRTFYVSFTLGVVLGVSKGSYASLAEAKADLSGTDIYYQLAEPIETPISVVNNATAYPNGTFLIEDVVRRIGVYNAGITVDKAIKALDNIYKLNDDGSSTKLAVSGATVAGDGLSFTHTSLSNSDFVWFDYYYQGTNVKGLSTVYYYGDKMIVSGSGTTSGKVYKIVPTVVDENIVWTKVEV
ncbi:MAG: hypothetical protein WC939_05755, partial [Acholeplasmataceae bacterium]